MNNVMRVKQGHESACSYLCKKLNEEDRLDYTKPVTTVGEGFMFVGTYASYPVIRVKQGDVEQLVPQYVLEGISR